MRNWLLQLWLPTSQTSLSLSHWSKLILQPEAFREADGDQQQGEEEDCLHGEVEVDWTDLDMSGL